MAKWGELEHDGDMYGRVDMDYARGPMAKSQSTAQIKKASKSQTNFMNRGMGATKLTRKPVTDAERMAMCHLRGKGLSNNEIAEELKRPLRTILNSFLEIEKLVKAQGLNYDWKEVVGRKAVAAITAGLDHEADPYKRGALGIQAAKGVGLMEQDNTVNFAQIISSIPESQRSRYLVTPDPDPSLVSLPEPKKENQ
jgi:hypothetical protein